MKIYSINVFYIGNRLNIHDGVWQTGNLSTHLYKLKLPDELETNSFGFPLGISVDSPLFADDVAILSSDVVKCNWYSTSLQVYEPTLLSYQPKTKIISYNSSNGLKIQLQLNGNILILPIPQLILVSKEIRK